MSKNYAMKVYEGHESNLS